MTHDNPHTSSPSPHNDDARTGVGKNSNNPTGGKPNLLDPAGKPALTPEEISRKASGRATWHRRASKPVSIWMFALFTMLFIHRWVPNSVWLMVHMVTLGLITNSILIWSQHFAEGILKVKIPVKAARFR